MSTEKYDIAVSYASEQRSYVERFVKRLQASNLYVYYDRNEQTRMVGKILDQELHKIYIEQSEHCVLFLSDSYIQKPATRYESGIILSETLYKNNFMYIFKFDDVSLPGLNRNFVYSSVKEFPDPEKYADFLYKVTQGEHLTNMPKVSLYETLSGRLKEEMEHIARQYGLDIQEEQQAGKSFIQLKSENSVLLQLQAGNLPGKPGVCLWLHRGARSFDKYAYQGYVQWQAKKCCYILENRGILSELTPEFTFSSLGDLVDQLKEEMYWLIGK